MALPQSYRELTGEVATQMRALRKTQPDLMSAFAALAAAGTKEGALGKKTRELVALGIAIASRCDDCIGFHVQTLVKLGTTREEFEDLLATAVYMGGGPSMMYAAHALRAVEEFGGSDGGRPILAIRLGAHENTQRSVDVSIADIRFPGTRFESSKCRVAIQDTGRFPARVPINENWVCFFLGLRMQFEKSALNCDASIVKDAGESLGGRRIAPVGSLVNTGPDQHQVASEPIGLARAAYTKISFIADLNV
ncbi:carboxymuconolactone decarboxylase family protein [Burkholderia pseudomallei]|nr:carboxymuconolactone decarboxylase family protein [Burkholderia pseudomallei]PPF05146.1 carboxymuconolactone decarboxylase family protein [Burkholderia pseudomallei]CAJ2833399.1 carboxymuconolactone decarboxylase family protein [Burkholderia pseudomallei]CAJ3414029.1 carboxymuconolactone decarboxylase family protein [Burkholderia pseudomallei]CAJ3766742.1 carboxymuconolactone decarboxylase family protein [Burkholderia pseudomallei]